MRVDFAVNPAKSAPRTEEIVWLTYATTDDEKLNVETGEVVEKTLKHESDSVREFYSTLPRPIRVGIEATGSMQWFLELMEELGIDCQVGHPAKIRAAEPRKQKHDRRDAALVLQLLVENRFPSIWVPSREQRDVRSLILYRHQWVRIRTRVQNALQAIALSHGLRRGSSLWSEAGQHAIASLSLTRYTAEMGRVSRVNVKRKDVENARAIDQALLRRHTSVLRKSKN